MSPPTRRAAPCCAWVNVKTSTASPLPAAPVRRAPWWSNAAACGAHCAAARSGAERPCRADQRGGRRRRLPLPFAGIPDHARRHQAVPDEQHDNRTDHGRDEARALFGTVVADRLTDESRQERARDTE